MMMVEYYVTYTGHAEEFILVKARDINSGFLKALKRAREPLGNGKCREIARVEFWKRVS
jgi:hypothetical protein